MSIGTKIKKLREELGLSQDELAVKMGYKSRSSINKIENGTNDIPQSKVIAFAKALNTTVAYLMDWEEKSETEKLPNNIIPISKVRYIPVLGRIACGEPLFADENLIDRIVLPENVNADFALLCKGDSMINAKIHDGDTVYICKQAIVENGEIAAVLIDDEATLKKVYISDTYIKLVSANDNYEPFVFYKEEMNQVKILGKAVAVLHKIQ
jgi:repressor LexA